MTMFALPSSVNMVREKTSIINTLFHLLLWNYFVALLTGLRSWSYNAETATSRVSESSWTDRSHLRLIKRLTLSMTWHFRPLHWSKLSCITKMKHIYTSYVSLSFLPCAPTLQDTPLYNVYTACERSCTSWYASKSVLSRISPRSQRFEELCLLPRIFQWQPISVKRFAHFLKNLKYFRLSHFLTRSLKV